MRKVSLLLIAIGAAYALYRIMVPPVTIEMVVPSTAQEQTAPASIAPTAPPPPTSSN